MNYSKKNISPTFIGLKGLIVLIIFFYHSFKNILPGGHIAYSFLFVLIGFSFMDSYLKTRLMPGPFLVKKIKENWFPVLLMVSCICVFYIIFNWSAFPWTRDEALFGLLLYQNFYQLTEFNSYFSNKILSPMSHLWVISAQVQIYFLCFLLLFGKKTKQKIINLTFFMLIVSLFSFIACCIYILIGIEAKNFLMRLEPRIFSFSLGFIFALYSNKAKIKLETENLDMITGFIMLLIVLCIFVLKGPALIQLLAIFVFSLLFAFILSFSNMKETNFSSFFEAPFFQFVGKRALYYFLWQYPVYFYLQSVPYFSNMNTLLMLLSQLPILFILGEISLFIFEKVKKINYLFVVLVGISASLFVFSFVSQKPISKAEKINNYQGIQEKAKVNKEKNKKTKDIVKVTEKEVFVPSKEVAASIEQINARFPEYRLNIKDLERLQSQGGMMIGDVLTVKNEVEYSKLMPRIQYDGSVDRQMFEIVEQVSNVVKSMGNSNTPIIIQLGAKADFNKESLEEVIKTADGQRIILISVVTPDPWEDSVNEKLKNAAEKYENVFLVDWYRVAKEQNDFFVEETAEIKPAGQRLMAQMIGHTLLSTSTSNSKNIENNMR